MKIEVNSRNVPTYRKYKEFEKAVISFLESKGYFEIDCPILVPKLEPSLAFDPIKISTNIPNIGTSLYLRPWFDPFYLRLAKENIGPFYIKGKVFRQEKKIDALRSIEFTMLEYYNFDCNQEGLIDELKELLLHVAKKVLGKNYLTLTEGNIDFSQIEILTVEEAFRRYSEIEIEDFWDTKILFEQLKNLFPNDSGTFRELWFKVLQEKIEPKLGKSGCPTVLKDFPIYIDQEGEENEDGRSENRFELFINGIELGNSYKLELASEKRETFFRNNALRRKESGRPVYSYDFDQLEFSDQIRSHYSMALGLDRLALIFLKLSSISDLKVISLSLNNLK